MQELTLFEVKADHWSVRQSLTDICRLSDSVICITFYYPKFYLSH